MVPDGVETMAFLRRQGPYGTAPRPDLIMLDVDMPGMNGFEVCEALAAEPELGRVPVLFISALSDSNSKVRAFRAGGRDFVTKPFSVEEVLARVATQIGRASCRERVSSPV